MLLKFHATVKTFTCEWIPKPSTFVKVLSAIWAFAIVNMTKKNIGTKGHNTPTNNKTSSDFVFTPKIKRIIG